MCTVMFHAVSVVFDRIFIVTSQGWHFTSETWDQNQGDPRGILEQVGTGEDLSPSTWGLHCQL